MTRRAIEAVIEELTIEPGNEAGMNQIVTGVWLGNESGLAETFQHHITIVVNVSDSIVPAPSGVTQYCYPMIDKWACRRNAMLMMKRCAYLVHLCREQGKNVMIYCKRGHHRSACVVLQYLVDYCSMDPVDAVRVIKTHRPTALRRISCMLDNQIVYHADN